MQVGVKYLTLAARTWYWSGREVKDGWHSCWLGYATVADMHWGRLRRTTELIYPHAGVGGSGERRYLSIYPAEDSVVNVMLPLREIPL